MEIFDSIFFDSLCTDTDTHNTITWNIILNAVFFRSRRLLNIVQNQSKFNRIRIRFIIILISNKFSKFSSTQWKCKWLLSLLWWFFSLIKIEFHILFSVPIWLSFLSIFLEGRFQSQYLCFAKATKESNFLLERTHSHSEAIWIINKWGRDEITKCQMIGLNKLG